jgi:hypothetical protein
MKPATNDDMLIAPAATDPVARQARHILAMRRRRREHFPDILFGEPGWELMLHLYVAEAERRLLSTQECVALSHLPASTATRWVGLLAAEGYVIEVSNGASLSLTPTARTGLKAFLRQFAEAPPAPVWRRWASRVR